MTTLREAAQQALEALLKSHKCPLLPDDCDESITALRAALAQQAEQQPMHPELRKMWEDHFDKCFRAIPVPEQAEPVEPVAWGWVGDPSTQDYASTQPDPVQPVGAAGLFTLAHLWAQQCYFKGLGRPCDIDSARGAFEQALKAYTAPPQRKPLTEEEIWHTYKNLWVFHPAEEPRLAGDVLKFARAVERMVRGEERC